MHVRARDLGEQARQRDAGKAAAGAEIDPDLASGAEREELQRIGDMAGPDLRQRRGRDEVGGLLPGGQQRRRSDRAALPFHVKRDSAPAPARGRRCAPAHACAARRADAAFPAHMRGEQRERRRRHAVEPPGLADGARPRGRELLPRFVGEAGHRRIVEVVGQREGFVAAIGGDIRRLARKIDIVFRVGLELLGDRGAAARRAAARSGASCRAKCRDRTEARTRCGGGRPS